MKQITEDEFDRQFALVDNTHDGSQTWEMEELKAAGIPADRTWSLMDGDEGGTYMVAGVHWVNVYAYSVTEESHDFDIQVEIESAEDEEERYETDKLTSSYTVRITGLDALYNTSSYIDAFICLLGDIEENNKSRIEEIQAKHPEFTVNVDLVIGGTVKE